MPGRASPSRIARKICGSATPSWPSPNRVAWWSACSRSAIVTSITALWAPFTTEIVFMGLEAAEMTKHAINAFLATSVAFMNEIATICEMVGADAKDVERGLKSEERIGQRAYLLPGGHSLAEHSLATLPRWRHSAAVSPRQRH